MPSLVDPFSTIGSDLPEPGAPPPSPVQTQGDPWANIGQDLPPVPGSGEVPQQPVQPTATADDPFASIGVDLPDAPQVDEPKSPGFFEEVGEAAETGFQRALTEAGQSTAAISGVPPLSPEDEQRFAQPITWGDVLDPQGMTSKLTYMTTRAAPSVGAGVAVGGATTAATGNPLAGLATGAAAAGVVTAAQTIGPFYAQEIQRTPEDPDSAFDRAMDQAGREGLIMGASWAAFGIAPFRGAVKNLLFQAFAVQPGVLGAAQIQGNLSSGRPPLEGVAETIPQAVFGTTIPALGVHGAHLLGKVGGGLNVRPTDAWQTESAESLLTDAAQQYAESQRQKDLVAEEVVATRDPSPEELQTLAEETPRPVEETLPPVEETPRPVVEEELLTPEKVEELNKKQEEILSKREKKKTRGPKVEKPLTNQEKFDAALERQKEERERQAKSALATPQTISDRMLKRGLRVIEGGEEPLPPKTKASEGAEPPELSILREGQKRLQEGFKNPPPKEVQNYVEAEAKRLGMSPEYVFDQMQRTRTDSRIPTYDNIWKGPTKKPSMGEDFWGDQIIQLEKEREAYRQRATDPLTPPEKVGEAVKIVRMITDTLISLREFKLRNETRELDNRPLDMNMHSKTYAIAKGFLEIKERMGIKTPLMFRFLEKIPEQPNWLGSNANYRGGRTRSFKEPISQSVIEIAVGGHSRVSEVYTTIAHEFGHYLVGAKIGDAPDSVKQGLLADYRKWRSATRPTEELRARVMQRDNAVTNYYNQRHWAGGDGVVNFVGGQPVYQPAPIKMWQLSPAQRRYWLSFEEFIAEQVAKWATTSAKPRTTVDKYLKGISKLLTQVWVESSKKFGLDFRPQTDLGQWLDSLMDQAPYLESIYKDMDTRTQAANARDLQRVGQDPLLARPRTPEVEPIRKAMTTLYGNEGNVPPKVRGTLATMDRFNRFVEWSLSIPQIAKINKDNIPLQLYNEDVALSKLDRDRIVARAHSTLRKWQDLSDVQSERLVGFIDDMMHMAYRSPEEATAGVRRQPTNEEFVRLAKDHKLGKPEIEQFARIKSDFDWYLGLVQELQMKDAAKIPDPVARAAAASSVRRGIAELKKAPYFPALRFGNFTLKVRDDAGRMTAFYTFKTAKEARAEKARIEKESVSGEIAEVGVLAEDTHGFSGLPPGLLDKISEKLAPYTTNSDGMQKAISEIRFELAPAQSFRHRLQRRKLTPGYSRDFRRAYANYFFHGANYYSRVKYHDILQQHIKDVRSSIPPRDLSQPTLPGRNTRGGADRIKMQQLANFMGEHFKEMMHPTQDFPLLRSAAFHWYLGVLPAKAFLNLSQTPLVTYPFLASKFGDVQAISSILDAGTDLSTFYRKGTLEAATEGEMRALGEGVREGVITEAMAPELAAVSEGRNLSRGVAGTKMQRMMHKAMELSAAQFALSEQVNRRVTYRAAYRLALRNPDSSYVREAVATRQRHYNRLVSEGWAENEAAAVVTAADATRSTQFEYNREALPKLFWGKKRTVFAFQTFKQNMLFYFYNYPSAAARTSLMLAFLGGMMGLPGAEDMKGILKAIGYQFFGKDFNLEKEARRFITSLAGEEEFLGMKGDDLADLAMHGTSRYGFGLPAIMDAAGGTVGVQIPWPSVDRSRQVGLGQLAPVSIGDIFGPPTNPERAKDALTKGALGATFSVPLNFWGALRDVQASGTFDRKLMERGLPSWMAALSKAGRYYSEGVERTRDGSVIARFDPNETEHMMEVLAVAMGYQPTRLSKEWTRIIAESEMASFWKLKKDGLYRQMDVAVRGGDQKEIDRVVGAIEEYNREAPEGRQITRELLEKSLKTRAKARAKKEAGIPDPEDVGIAAETRQLYGEPISVEPVR